MLRRTPSPSQHKCKSSQHRCGIAGIPSTVIASAAFPVSLTCPVNYSGDDANQLKGVMVAGSVLRLGFATLALGWVVFPLAAKLLELNLGGGTRSIDGGPTKSIRTLLVRIAVGEIPPILLTVWCGAYAVFAMFVPLMGRVGLAAPADAIIGLLVGVFTALLGSTSSTLAIGISRRGESPCTNMHVHLLDPARM